jgi:hypothetical protein
MNPIKIMVLNAVVLVLCGTGLLQSAVSPGRGGAVASGTAKGPAIDTGLGCANSTNGVTSISCTINDVPAGEIILINYTAYTNNFASVTDSNSGTVSILPGYPVTFTGSGYDYVIVITNTGAGTHLLTIKMSSDTSYPTMIADLISGASLTAPIDTANNFAGTTAAGGASTFNCGEVTTSTPGELLVSFANIAGASPELSAGTTPQVMTISQSGAPNAKSAYGNAATIGLNHVKWGVAAGPNNYSCDTVAVH